MSRPTKSVMDSMAVSIVSVEAAATWTLRQAVLRPRQPLSEMQYPGDGDPATVHLGACSDTAIVGIASIYREAQPGGDEMDGGWRLRGMATAPQARGTGVGARLLGACIDIARTRGGAYLWCNARSTAVGFYERFDFAKVGEEFDLPGIGPHYVMRRAL